MHLPASTLASVVYQTAAIIALNLQCMIMAFIAKASNRSMSNIRNKETWLKLQTGLAYDTSDIMSDSYQIFH